MGLWGTFMEAIPAYTGLSPVTFFTLLAVLVGVYQLVSGMFVSPDRHETRDFVPMEPIPQPVQLGDITAEELKGYDGSDTKKPLLMAIKGNIYDVSQSRMFYGPGGPYALFAGKDASRALAKMSFEEKDLTGDLEGLGPFELDALQDWEYKFMGKYVKVGQIVKKTVDKENIEGSSKDEPEAGHNTREVKITEDTPASEEKAVAANGAAVADAWKAEVAEKPKENGAEPKEDVTLNGTDSVEISEASEDAQDGKKHKEIVHEANHGVEVA
uniref:TSA: Wollemia nobilis Ref_Wollemi_Transcript_22706_1307 transcribed RNA sequence n=1 Tax=Wollemia nobilis TaxID=56998 RepID=A0A0C9S1T1_9CONI